MTTPVKVDFGEGYNTEETPRERMRRYYNEMAKKQGYKDIEEYYVKTKFALATKGELTTEENNLSNFLKTVAQDLGYTQSSKEYVMQNNLPSISGASMIGK